MNGRHFNCSVIYLSQSFLKIPKNIRDTSSHFCVFRFLSKENKRIADDLGVDPSSLDKATKEPYSFLFYDKPRKKELKILMNLYKMGFWNGQSQSVGGKGPRGPAGAGFKLTSDENFNLQNKKLTNDADATQQNEAVTKSQLDQKPDSTSVLLLNGQNHMTGDLDLRGNRLILPGEINMDRKLIKNLDVDETDDLSAVNMATLKKFSSSSSGDIDLQDKFNVKNSKQQSFSHLSSNYDNLVSYDDVKNIFLSRKETFAMEAGLDMGNQAIFNVKDPTVSDHGANKKYVDAETAKVSTKVNQLTSSTNTKFATAQNERNQKADKSYVDTTFLKLSGRTMASDIDTGGNKITNLPSPGSSNEPATKHYVDQSHLSQSAIQKNEFLYLMQDVNESSSESNITVLGIKKFPQTPHSLNKNAYKFTMRKDAQDKYASRIGFNLYQLPAGAYTFVVEFFPPKLNNVSIDCRSTSINVNYQTMKNFPTYCKNLVQLHKWKISPPEYLMVDIKCDGDASSPVNGVGWMVVYGIEGTHNDVPSAVCDRPNVIHRGTVLMEIPLDMNYQILRNLPDPTADFQAARKKYVDDKTVTKLDHSGGSMLGDIDMNANSITNLAYPTNQADAATKQYVDISGIFSILNSATATYVDGYIKQNAECLYSCERELPSEARFTPSTRAISTLFDQTLSGLNVNQSVVARRPKLSTGKNAKRFSSLLMERMIE